MQQPFRRTTQVLAPAHHDPQPTGQYDIYPGFDIGSSKIAIGYAALVNLLMAQASAKNTRNIILDGYIGTLWADVRERLDAEFAARGMRVAWHNIDDALKTPQEIESLVAPFLGGDDPLFGTRFTGGLREFFADKLLAIAPDEAADYAIVYGCGAALANLNGVLAYADVPKNEIQFRARAKSVANLGLSTALDPKPAYKRSYFVDWPALNQHKAALLPKLDVMIDGQRPDEPTTVRGDDLRAALTAMSRNFFRVRPWFEPGPWGGQWIKQHVPQLPQDAPNYAWSFELIVPENGLMLMSDGVLLEIAFDWLMMHDCAAVLGNAAGRFGVEFPIRFDFLDTFNGGNLSVQCHPRPDFAKQHFGENFTQDETYYILDCGGDAEVYLGFREGVEREAFRAALNTSFAEATPLDVDRWVQRWPAHKHDLFLIPNGTIHCSGQNNLVLEISATPYIFTFKMYDWMRMDLDGKPRPLNIERAMANLYFERQGARVQDELISRPSIIAEGGDWQLVHVPTHAEHFYDVHRYEFHSAIDVETNGQCHVLSLVEGTTVMLETANGMRQRFSFAETFVVPAAAGRYRLINEGSGAAKVVKAFVKDSAN